MQRIIRPLYFTGICFAILAIAIVFVWNATNMTLGSMTSDKGCPVVNHSQNFEFFSATTTSATSTTDGFVGADVKCAKKVTFTLTHGGVATTSTGTSIFNVQGSTDQGTTWYDLNKLVQNLSTSTVPTTLPRITVGAATTTTFVSLDLQYDTFTNIRLIVVETGPAGAGGEHTGIGTIEF